MYFLVSYKTDHITVYNLSDYKKKSKKIKVPLPRINYYKNGFSYCGAILWNSIPCDLKTAESLRQFKPLLKGNVEGTAFVCGAYLFIY